MTTQTPAPLSFGADQLLAALVARVGAESGVNEWLEALLADQRQTAAEAGGGLNLDRLETAVHDRIARSETGALLTRDEVAAHAGRHASEQGHDLAMAADVASVLLEAARDLVATPPPEQASAAVEPEPAPEEAPELPLSFGAERLLASLSGGADAAAGSHELVLGLLERHRDLAARAGAGIDLTALETETRARLQRGERGKQLARDRLAGEVSRLARAQGREVVSSADVAAAVLAAGPEISVPARTEEEPEEPPAEEARPAIERAAVEEGIVRVFVSSTFRDMQAERDALVRSAFPELQRRCRERGVEFSAIDLRWGITAEQAARGEVLEVCLDEIDRCRPFFIGILGSRYGWVPDAIDPRVLGDHNWLGHYPGASITELEWRYGALNDPAATTSLFYLRRAAAAPPGTPEAPDAPARLAALEADVRNSGLPVRDAFNTPEELSDLVLDDLWCEIEHVLPADGSFSDAAKRRQAQRAFLDSRLRVYVDRPEYFAHVDDHLTHNAAPLLVSGPAGAGKSALLANWVDRRRRAAPDAAIIFHSVAASPGSTDYRGLVRALIEELEHLSSTAPPEGIWSMAGGNITVTEWIGGSELLSDDELVPTLGEKLARAAQQGDVVLVIDGLDQMHAAADAADLLWLPGPLPENVAVIVSARDGAIADRAAAAAAGRLEVTPLTEPERVRMIVEQLRVLHGKRLADTQARQIARAPQAANPLFLKTFLEELRLLGSFDLLDESIDYYLSAATTGELVDLILERCEHDYDPDGIGLVADAMAAIWASSRGLFESELLDTCGIPQALWSPLRMALQESLVSYSGMIGFSHDEIADTITARYLPSAEDRRSAHRRLADFFAAQEVSHRVATELLYQLDAAKDWQRLADALLDLPILAEAWETEKPAICRYWEHVEGATDLALADAYADVIARPDDFESDHVWAVAALLMNVRHTDASLPLQRRLVDEMRDAGEPGRLQAALGNYAVSLFFARRHDEALACHDEEEQLCRGLGADQELEMCLGNKVNVLMALERWDEARSALEEAMFLCRAHGDIQQLARRLAMLEGLEREHGDLVAAEATLREAVPVIETSGDHVAIEACAQHLNDLGVSLKNAELYELAEGCYRDAERLARALGRDFLLTLATMNRGVVLGRMRRVDEAIDVLAEAEAMARVAGDRDNLMKCLFNRAGRLMEAGRPAEVIPALDEAMQLARETGQEQLLPDMERMAADARSHLW